MDLAALLTSKQVPRHLSAFKPVAAPGVYRLSQDIKEEGANLTLYLEFDRKTLLLVETKLTGEISGEKVTENTRYSALQPNAAAPAGMEKFVPPSGFRQVTVDEAEAYFDYRLKPGSFPHAFSVRDIGNKPHSIAAYKGKVLLLDFWATWCGPCVEEMPNVLAAYRKHRKAGFEVLGISLDEDRPSLVDFVKTNHIPWPQTYSGKGWQDSLVAKYRVKAIPFTLLIGRDGKIAAVNPRGEELESAVAAALKRR